MKRLGLLVWVLVLAGCVRPPPPAAIPAPSFPGLAQGIDMPTDARDVSMELKGSKLDFVARYYRDPTSRWPTLSAEEARAVSASGMNLVVVWESHSQHAEYFSYASGYSDGIAAYEQARAIGQPAGSAIYFAVDYNAPQSDIMGRIDPYFRGVLAGMIAGAGGRAPEYRVGIYGSGAVCEYLKGARLAQYAWLSNSSMWDGYDRFADWNIRQHNGPAPLSFSQDENEAVGDYGGFKVPSGQVSAL